ncbi:hypothetical protein L1049_028348 [Liquidambar formosana]|uniref:Protein kinase domain-containing protein n=1 Tax=Liquidambar formosana TaxID=63359 RepID=A0AAP0WWW9_LIQFO
MEFTPGKTHLSLLIFFSLLLLTHAKLTLHRSDHDALLTIQRDLGINGQRQPLENPCNTAGVYCERRISNDSTTPFHRITRVVFKSQGLGGFLSPAIGRLSQLRELSLPNNQLADQLPPQIVDCRKLEILNLKNNRFSGEVPLELSLLVRLRVLDLSSNKFSGNLAFLKYFPNLENLSLAENLFSGKIPASIRSFRNLRFANFSGNSFLQGPVPVISSRVETSKSSSSAIPKRYIFVENSTGPTAAKNNSSTSTAATGPSAAQAPGPLAPPHKHRSDTRKLSGWILGFLAGALAGSVSGLVFSVLLKLPPRSDKRWREGFGRQSQSDDKKAEDLAFLEKEDGVASLEIIGRGGCEEVYKAELPGSNGKNDCNKESNRTPKRCCGAHDEDSKLLNKKMRQIRSEIQTVGQIRHRNLLSLLAHVTRPDCHYLVYEFMKNGSLQDLLTDVSQGKRELDWLARHRIALGVAAGLEYLHMNHSPRIIHRDLKPANILLDDDMEARIADFGLAKAMPDAYTHVTTSNVAGTVGYIAPEYHQTLKFTDKCDIYSFGVLLGVLVMGKLPSDDFFQHTAEMSLVKWMRNVMTSENPSQAIDSKLMGNGFQEQMLLVLKIACFCTLDDPKQRPNSKDVRCMLSQIKH